MEAPDSVSSDQDDGGIGKELGQACARGKEAPDKIDRDRVDGGLGTNSSDAHVVKVGDEKGVQNWCILFNLSV